MCHFLVSPSVCATVMSSASETRKRRHLWLLALGGASRHCVTAGCRRPDTPRDVVSAEGVSLQQAVQREAIFFSATACGPNALPLSPTSAQVVQVSCRRRGRTCDRGPDDEKMTEYQGLMGHLRVMYITRYVLIKEGHTAIAPQALQSPHRSGLT